MGFSASTLQLGMLFFLKILYKDDDKAMEQGMLLQKPMFKLNQLVQV